MSNSTLFTRSLNARCAIENSHPSFPVKGIAAALDKGEKKGSKQIISQQIHSMPCLPYNQLRDLLEQDIYQRRELLNSLPEESVFSIDQVIDGCANALRFESERTRFHEIMRVAIEHRDGHLIIKNPDKGEERATRRAIAALALNPTIANATRWKTGNDVPSRAPSSINDLDPTVKTIAIQLHIYGCAYYPQDRLRSPKQPSIEALLAFNLAYIFRHWPVSEATFPTFPPRRQQRKQQPKNNNGKPRLDIVAHFVNALFPPSDGLYCAEQIKNLLNKMKTAGAVFCGW